MNIYERLSLFGSSACESRHRPFSRVALDKGQRIAQLKISRKPTSKIPKIKEKRLVGGKWTRDYE